MNRLPLTIRVQVLSSLVEGNSIRGTCRMVGVDKKTVLRLLADVGDAYAAVPRRHDPRPDVRSGAMRRNMEYCHAKERNLKPKLRGRDDYGDLWTWVGMDADTKLVVSWVLGKRTWTFARRFMLDLASRIKSYVQISTDGLAM